MAISGALPTSSPRPPWKRTFSRHPTPPSGCFPGPASGAASIPRRFLITGTPSAQGRNGQSESLFCRNHAGVSSVERSAPNLRQGQRCEFSRSQSPIPWATGWARSAGTFNVPPIGRGSPILKCLVARRRNTWGPCHSVWTTGASPECASGKSPPSPAGPVPHGTRVFAPTNPGPARSGPASRKRVHSGARRSKRDRKLRASTRESTDLWLSPETSFRNTSRPACPPYPQPRAQGPRRRSRWATPPGRDSPCPTDRQAALGHRPKPPPPSRPDRGHHPGVRR